MLGHVTLKPPPAAAAELDGDAEILLLEP